MSEEKGVRALDCIKVGEIEPYVLSNVQLQLNASKESQGVSALWISGGPGIGKSWIMAKICQKNDFALVPEYMGTMLLEQITGLPKALNDDKSDETLWTKPQMFTFKNTLVTASRQDRPTILFLDDAHLCNKSIQTYMFQMLTYRGIHHHRLPNNVAIIMAGNRSSDKAGFQQILAPVSNRLYFLDVECDVDDWIDNFAASNGVRTDIISFLQNNQTYIQSTPLESTAWASPRSWTFASRMLDQYEDSLGDPDIMTLTRLVSGHVGLEYATKFVEYKKLLMDWHADEILNKTRPMPKIEDLDRTKCYCLMSACIGEFLKQYRKRNFSFNKDLEEKVSVLKTIVEKLCKTCKAIVPLGLKILILGEKEKEKTRKESQAVIVKKLLTDPEIVDMIAEIVG